MASLEVKITEVLTEVRTLRTALRDETTERRRDHDIIIRLQSDLETAGTRIAALEKKHDKVSDESNKRVWQALAALIGAIITGLIGWLIAKFGGGGGTP
jgi:F0F1-type ATP synthase assembly protein I